MTTSTVPSGETCPEGGLAYAWGLDLDANGTLDANEVLETSFLCHGTEGADGANGQPGLDGHNGSDGADGQREHGPDFLGTAQPWRLSCGLAASHRSWMTGWTAWPRTACFSREKSTKRCASAPPTSVQVRSLTYAQELQTH